MLPLIANISRVAPTEHIHSLTYKLEYGLRLRRVLNISEPGPKTNATNLVITQSLLLFFAWVLVVRKTFTTTGPVGVAR